jgi:hypothetical protein
MMVNNYTNINNMNSDIGGIVDHHSLEAIVHVVNIGGIGDHHCLEAIVHVVDIGGIVDHRCLEAIVHVEPMMVNNSTNFNNMNIHL